MKQVVIKCDKKSPQGHVMTLRMNESYLTALFKIVGKIEKKKLFVCICTGLVDVLRQSNVPFVYLYKYLKKHEIK
jgi:hypothetical protein